MRITKLENQNFFQVQLTAVMREVEKVERSARMYMNLIVL